MTLDDFLNFASDVTNKALPILGFVVLIFLIICIRHLICLLKSANAAVISMQRTLDTANKDLEALDKPLQTLNELSETVDNVHEASKSAVKSVIAVIIDNFASIKDWAFHKENTTEETVVCDIAKDDA